MGDVTWLTVKECADDVGVSAMTIYRLIHTEKLPAIRVERSFRVDQRDWQSYLEGGRI